MDPCTSASEGKITWTENKYSKNKKESKARFVCKSGNWELATDLEKDTEGWTSGKDGQVKNGKVNTDSVYVYDGAAWRKGNVLDSTLGIGACYTKANRRRSMQPIKLGMIIYRKKRKGMLYQIALRMEQVHNV